MRRADPQYRQTLQGRHSLFLNQAAAVYTHKLQFSAYTNPSIRTKSMETPHNATHARMDFKIFFYYFKQNSEKSFIQRSANLYFSASLRAVGQACFSASLRVFDGMHGLQECLF